jgi:DnaK suppressor protein
MLKHSYEVEILEPTLEALGIEQYKVHNNEDYMNSNMLTHFAQILAAMRAQIMKGVDRTVIHLKEEAINYADPNDRASQEEDFRLELRARDRERKLLKKIEEALELISNNDYGYCEVCGVEIGLRRLEARPTATLCVDCKSLEEIREKQKASE